jgi:hypothetical protein
MTALVPYRDAYVTRKSSRFRPGHSIFCAQHHPQYDLKENCAEHNDESLVKKGFSPFSHPLFTHKQKKAYVVSAK